MSHSMVELRALMQYDNNRQILKERMYFTRNGEFLQAAFPRLMEHGGLPTKAVVVDNGAVFVQLIKERVSCPMENVAGGPVPQGTTVLCLSSSLRSGFHALWRMLLADPFHKGQRRLCGFRSQTADTRLIFWPVMDAALMPLSR